MPRLRYSRGDRVQLRLDSEEMGGLPGESDVWVDATVLATWPHLDDILVGEGDGEDRDTALPKTFFEEHNVNTRVPYLLQRSEGAGDGVGSGREYWVPHDTAALVRMPPPLFTEGCPKSTPTAEEKGSEKCCAH